MISSINNGSEEQGKRDTQRIKAETRWTHQERIIYNSSLMLPDNIGYSKLEINSVG